MIPVIQTQGSYFDHNSRRYRCCCRCCHVKTGTWILVIMGCFGCLYGLLAPMQVTLPSYDENTHIFNDTYNFTVLWKNESDHSQGFDLVEHTHVVNKTYRHFNPYGRPVKIGKFVRWFRCMYIINVVVYGCALIALMKKKHCFLIPYLVSMGFGIFIYLLVLSILLVGNAVCSDEIKAWMIEMSVTYNINLHPGQIKLIYNFMVWYMVFVIGLGLLFQVWYFTIIKGCYDYFKDLKKWEQDSAGQLPQTVQYIQNPDYQMKQ